MCLCKETNSRNASHQWRRILPCCAASCLTDYAVPVSSVVSRSHLRRKGRYCGRGKWAGASQRENQVTRNNGCSRPKNQCFSLDDCLEKRRTHICTYRVLQKGSHPLGAASINTIVYYVIAYRSWPSTGPVLLFCCIEAD